MSSVVAHAVWLLGSVFSALVALVIVHWAYTVHYKMRNCKLKMASGYIPVVGHLFRMLPHLRNLTPWLSEELAYAGGGAKTVWAYIPLNDPIVVTSDPRVAKHVLKDNFDNYPKGEHFHQRGIDLFGDGIFGADGPHWKAQRRLGAHTFKGGLLKAGAIEVYSRHADSVIEQLDAVSPGAEFDVQKLFFAFTLDSLGELAFGRNIDSLHHASAFHQAFDYIQKVNMERLLLPWYKLHPLFNLLSYWSSLKTLNSFCAQVIKEKFDDKDIDPSADVVSRFIVGAREGTDQRDYGFKFDTNFIRDVIANFMVAGRDTTGVTLTFALYNLSGNSTALAQLEKEIADTCGSGLAFQRPTYAQLTKGLPFLRAVIDETLRLYPPVYIDPKTSIKADTLPGDVELPGGAMVAWCQYLMSHQDEFWSGGPSNEFHPERWMGHETGARGSASRTGLLGEANDESDGEVKMRAPLLFHPYQFIPFQAGPRTCLGMRMAYVEVGYLLCILLNRYRFTVPPGFQPKLITTITLQAEEMPMRISRRDE